MNWLISIGALLVYFGYLYFAGARLIDERRYLSYYLIGAFLIALANAPELVAATRLMQSHAQAEGHLVDGVCTRGTVRYIFEVQGTLFRDYGKPSNRRFDCANVRVGAPVEVEYLPADPSISTMGTAASRFRNAFGWTLLLAVLVPLASLFTIRRAFQNREL